MARRQKKGGIVRAVRNTFLPHPENGRHPHVLRGQVILGLIILVLLVEVGVLAQTFYFAQMNTMTAAVLPAVVADLTNQQRADNGIPALTVSPLLTDAAQDKANDMAAKGYFSHVSPSGQLPWYWFQQVGYNYQFAGENLAINFSDSQQLVDAWMNSPMHRANILKQNYTQIGIGIATGMYQGQETTFVVEFFGAPGSSAPSVTQTRAPSSSTQVAVTTYAPAQQNPEQISPTVPIETAAPASVAQQAPPESQILGLQTQRVQEVSWWMKIVSSPSTYITYFLLALGALFLALVILGLLPITPHVPHPNALMNGAALLAVVFGIMLLNHSLLFGVRVDAPDSENAAVVFSR